GGISSSYFHEELVRHPAVDFVLRGSVTEPCLLALVQELEGERRFERVPNLTWKDHGRVRVNPTSFAPRALDPYDLDAGMIIGSVVGHLDFWTSIPFHAWWRHPITAVLTVRGCARGCVTCGGSNFAFKQFMQAHHPLLRGPDAIASQVRQFASFTRAPVFLVGDINDGGSEYAHTVVEAIGRLRVSNRIIFEFFEPPPADLLQCIDDRIPHWGAELSPESHDEALRARLGKAHYTNAELEAGIARMLALRCENLDMFFMVGLPGQTYDSVMQMTDVIEGLFRRFDRRLSAYITPMGPFIDPGSEGFEHAEAHGYRLRAHTLAEHRALLENGRDWESFLNYSTDAMSRAAIVDATYDGAERLNALKQKYGRIDAAQANAVAARMQGARELRRRFAEAGGRALDPVLHREMLGDVRAYSENTVNAKAELFPPGAFFRSFRVGGILRLLAREVRLKFTGPVTGA
ncbi:MAG: hypothetical protein ACRENQ_03200, partial [Gemmatimonadaceae bacterium]